MLDPNEPKPIRIHRLKFQAEYEGEPFTEDQLQELIREFGDILSIQLRGRDMDADAIYSAGMHQEIDIEEEDRT